MSKTKRNRQPVVESTNQPQILAFPKPHAKSVRIVPRNMKQEEYLEYLNDENKIIVLALGPAGTGKTHLAMLAGIKALQSKQIQKLILTRPVVNVEGEEKLGALPGTLEEKMDPYVRPLFDVLLQYYCGKDITRMMEDGVLEIAPLSFMRGRNFNNAWIVLDEAQNCNDRQLKVLATRICENSKLVITGDNDQSDRRNSDNGLFVFDTALDNYGGSDYIARIEFEHQDIQRHPVVGVVLDIFKSVGK